MQCNSRALFISIRSPTGSFYSSIQHCESVHVATTFYSVSFFFVRNQPSLGLQRGPPPRFEREQQGDKPRYDEERSSNEDGDRARQVCVECYDRCLSYLSPISSYYAVNVESTHHDSENAVRSGNERIARSAVFGGEELGAERVEHAVHDVRGERVRAIEPEQRVGGARGRRGEDEDPREC